MTRTLQTRLPSTGRESVTVTADLRLGYSYSQLQPESLSFVGVTGHVAAKHETFNASRPDWDQSGS